MPYYKCLNKDCISFNKEELVDKITLYYDSKLNFSDLTKLQLKIYPLV